MNIRLKQECLCVLLAILLLPTALQAQKLTVESFQERPNDISARTHETKDINGISCALVKVQLAAQGAKFEQGVVGTPYYKTSEYWAYMVDGSKRLTIKLEGYLPLEVTFADYGIAALRSKCTYVMVVTGVVAAGQGPSSPTKVQAGWLIINSTPSDADVYLKINGVESFEGKTPFQKKLAYGTYAYRVKTNLYHDAVGVVEVNNSQVELNASLKAAYGRISISSNPSDASVVIEGLRESYSTPCTTDILPSGQYQLTISKAKYATDTRKVTVRDGAVESVHVDLSANFAQVTISSLPDAQIYLNGTMVGVAPYSVNLTPGIYDFEARLDNHHAARQQVEVESNTPQTITLNPTPICGSLDVISEPMKATVTINGRNYGKTPLTIEDLPVGSYKVVLTKDGYDSETASVTIEEGETAELSRKLDPSGRRSRSTTPSMSDSPARKQPLLPSETQKDFRWFFLADATLSPSLNAASHATTSPMGYGLTVGMVKQWGVYASFTTNGCFSENRAASADGEGFVDEVAPLYTNDYKTSNVIAAVGATYRIFRPAWLYLGLGYGKRTYCQWSEADPQGHILIPKNSYSGLALDCGAMVHLKAFTFSVGATAVLDKDYGNDAYIEGKLGVGVSF